MSRVRGAALLLVLWLIALLTALIGAFALTARIESLQGKVLSGGAEGQELARAGLEYALVRVADVEPTSRWLPDGRVHRWNFAGAELEIRIVDETGKVELNQADAVLLAALMQAVGTQREQAERVAAAIVDWRDSDVLSQVNGGAEDPEYASAGLPYGAKDALFESVAEVEQVLGMTPELYAALEPYLTVHGGSHPPNATYAPGPVLTAMGLDADAILAQRAALVPATDAAQLVAAGTGTYSIDSRARRAEGRGAALQATVRAGSGSVPGSVYTVLRWQEGTAPQ